MKKYASRIAITLEGNLRTHMIVHTKAKMIDIPSLTNKGATSMSVKHKKGHF